MDDGKKLEEAILALIARTVPSKPTRASLTADVSLRRDLGLDSLGLVSLLAGCAEALDVDPDELIEAISFEHLNTVGDLLALGAKLARGARQ